MEQRFKFKAPSLKELRLAQWGRLIMWFVFLVCLGLSLLNWSIGFWELTAFASLAAVALYLTWRLGDINRRDAQFLYGSIELTDRELRISLSERSLMRIHWHDFTGVEVKKGWLYFRYLDAQIDMGGQSIPLHRVRLSELETPDVLLDALRAQTASAK